MTTCHLFVSHRVKLLGPYVQGSAARRGAWNWADCFSRGNFFSDRRVLSSRVRKIAHRQTDGLFLENFREIAFLQNRPCLVSVLENFETMAYKYLICKFLT